MLCGKLRFMPKYYLLKNQYCFWFNQSLIHDSLSIPKQPKRFHEIKATKFSFEEVILPVQGDQHILLASLISNNKLPNYM